MSYLLPTGMTFQEFKGKLLEQEKAQNPQNQAMIQQIQEAKTLTELHKLLGQMQLPNQPHWVK